MTSNMTIQYIILQGRKHNLRSRVGVHSAE